MGLTLWGDSAEVQGAELEQSEDAILSVSSCRVGDFNGALGHRSNCKQHRSRRPASGIEVALSTVGLEGVSTVGLQTRRPMPQCKEATA